MMLGEVAFYVLFVVAIGPTYDVDVGGSMATRSAYGAAQIFGGLQLWWVAVIVGEFAAACRETVLLQQSERVGYGILFTLGALIIWLGWRIPVNSLGDDDLTVFLSATASLSQLIILFWLLQPVMRATTVAKVLLQRIEELTATHPETPGEEAT